jgi:hypothetical protein
MMKVQTEYGEDNVEKNRTSTMACVEINRQWLKISELVSIISTITYWLNGKTH